MRRVLVLGGTGWLGAEVVRAALSDGAEVTCVARGCSGEVPAGATLVTVDRTEPDAYDAVAESGPWDDVVELSYDPALVGPAVDALADRAKHWTLVSSVSVYARHDRAGDDEGAPTVDPVDLERYPDAKIHAERLTQERLGGRLLIARPGLIVGPGDPSDRFGYWPARFDRGGRVLVPRIEGRVVQVIDVGDLGAWLARTGREHVTGVVDAVGRPRPLAELFALCAEATGFDGELVPVADDALTEHGVRRWSGPHSLPLWLPDDMADMMNRAGDAYLAAGGTLLPLSETIARTRDDERGRGLDRPRRSGMTRAEEEAVLLALRRDDDDR